MSDPVSIIIPTRNRSAILAKCLAALPTATVGFDRVEVIVVDDCSSDSTPQIVEEFRRSSAWRVRCLRQDRPMGANAARNAAIKVATGQFIVLIDDDVIAAEGWLESLLRNLSDDYPVVSGAVKLSFEGPIVGRHREEVSTYLSEVLKPALGMHGEVVPVAGNMAAFRWVFDQTIFDETVGPPSEEGDWLFRAGASCKFVPEALVWHCKDPREATLRRLVKLAWFRGSEWGWWARERMKVGWKDRFRMAAQSLITFMRAFGHAGIRGCSGGIVVGLGELSRALAMTGMINRGPRVPQSWR